MKKVILVLTLLTFSSLCAEAQLSLKVVIEGLENDKGAIIMDFRDGGDEKLKAFSENIKDKQCVFMINDLKSGKYSFKYFHDENKNNKMDTYWIGAPKEGIGFSNNAKGKFGPPDFKDTVFEIKKDTTLKCRAYYFKL